MDAFWRVFQRISNGMRSVGAALLVVMAALTCVDVVGRLLKHPVFGSIELMYLMGALAVALALPDTHMASGHIGVEIVVSRFSRKVRALVDLFTGALSLALFAVVTWQMFSYSLKMMESGEVSMNLELPEYIIIFVVACGFVVFSFAIVKDLADTFGKLRGR